MEGEGTSEQHGMAKGSPDPNPGEEPIPVFLEASPVPTSANETIVSVDGATQSRSLPGPEDPVELSWRAKYLPRYLLHYNWLQPKYEDRRVWSNHSDYNRMFKYANNEVVTSKYSIISFLPRNLLEQFMRVANIYFLILLLMQLIPEVVPQIPSVSSVGSATTIIPLLLVLGVTAVKDAFDDIKRHISDYRVNHRKSHVLINNVFQEVSWQNIEVGDLVLLQNNDFVTADIVLLAASEPHSLSYVETAELDGETNLKVRQALGQTHDVLVREGENGNELIVEELSKFDGFVVCSAPNNNLHKFEGTLVWDGLDRNREPLNLDQLLLRGCRLRNTSWAVGLVVYAGHETKLVKNGGRTLLKRTQLDRAMNFMVIAILCFLILLVLCCFIGSLVWELFYGQYFQVYVPYDQQLNSPVGLAFYQILSNVIILNTLVPISLYVSVELIRLCQSFLINWDITMYYEEEDTPAQARTTTLNEELGQIDYIFSDKTGTLTQNVMVFHKCCIGKECTRYGDTHKEDKIPANLVDMSWNPYADESFAFYDQRLIKDCQRHTPEVARYFKLVALCHTVLSNIDEGDKITYNAQSPDEAALVSAARNFGYVFADRSPFSVTLYVVNKKDNTKFDTLEYKILNILDFNNVRKRMSVIVQCPDEDPDNPGEILLLCKGADSTVGKRLDRASSDRWQTSEEVLQDYAREGLRTLCMAYRVITPEEYSEWDKEHHDASVAAENRDAKVSEVYEKIEKNMKLLGLSAIEDKLQDGVPEAIYNLTRANLKVWVLTGDKMETAINIGYSCKLLQGDMELYCIDEEDQDAIMSRLDEMQKASEGITESRQSNMELSQSSGNGKKERLAMVISGASLAVIFERNLQRKFLEVASLCTSVVCSRVTPKQKRRVVELVKTEKKAITLAIGDGANDVGMIKAAHIGVGISGHEGRQAVLASDFSFGQFRFLERLLLIHGRWSYHRMAIFLRYFFYKNFSFTFAQFLFAWFCGFTGQTVYSQGFITLYNVVYTSIPVVALAVLDQDVDEDCCRNYPQLYTLGQKRVEFNPRIFLMSLGKGIMTAFLIFFFLFGLSFGGVLPVSGYELDYDTFAFMAAGALTLIVNVQILLDTLLWTPITHFFIWFSILSYFFIAVFFSIGPFYSSNFIYDLFNNNMGTPGVALSSSTFYFYCVLLVVLTMFLVLFKRILMVMLMPQLVDFVRLKIHKTRNKRLQEVLKDELLGKKPSPELSSRPVMKVEGKEIKSTGYAFSGTEGAGELLMSGTAFASTNVTESRRRRSEIHSAYYSEETDPNRPQSSRLRHSHSRQSLRSTHSEQTAWKHETDGDNDGNEVTDSQDMDTSRSGSPKTLHSTL